MQSFEKLFLTFDSQPVSRKKKQADGKNSSVWTVCVGENDIVTSWQSDIKVVLI